MPLWMLGRGDRDPILGAEVVVFLARASSRASKRPLRTHPTTDRVQNSRRPRAVPARTIVHLSLLQDTTQATPERRRPVPRLRFRRNCPRAPRLSLQRAARTRRALHGLRNILPMTQAERGSPAPEIRIFHRATRRFLRVARKPDRLHQRNYLPHPQSPLATTRRSTPWRRPRRARLGRSARWLRPDPELAKPIPPSAARSFRLAGVKASRRDGGSRGRTPARAGRR